MIVVEKVSSVLVGNGDDDRTQCLRKWGRLSVPFDREFPRSSQVNRERLRFKSILDGIRSADLRTVLLEVKRQRRRRVIDSAALFVIPSVSSQSR